MPNDIVKLDNNFKHSFIHDLLTVRFSVMHKVAFALQHTIYRCFTFGIVAEKTILLQTVAISGLYNLELT